MIGCRLPDGAIDVPGIIPGHDARATRYFCPGAMGHLETRLTEAKLAHLQGPADVAGKVTRNFFYFFIFSLFPLVPLFFFFSLCSNNVDSLTLAGSMPHLKTPNSTIPRVRAFLSFFPSHPPHIDILVAVVLLFLPSIYLPHQQIALHAIFRPLPPLPPLPSLPPPFLTPPHFHHTYCSTVSSP
ncbi:hypothetical protein F5B20DRAFT_427128 [Whalleya microplaca]|nr:hypothetical protein F5B20DRAFT_427128 [Whalleya microplaca]